MKNLVLTDVYPLKFTSSDNVEPSTSATSSQVTHHPVKTTTYDLFIAACGDQESLMETNKEKSKRIRLNEELKYFRTAVQDFNTKNQPSTTTAIEFWKLHHPQLPILAHLAKAHLVASGSSVPSESAFSCSAHVARKERSRLTPENLAYSVFLKDKLDRN